VIRDARDSLGVRARFMSGESNGSGKAVTVCKITLHCLFVVVAQFYPGALSDLYKTGYQRGRKMTQGTGKP